MDIPESETWMRAWVVIVAVVVAGCSASPEDTPIEGYGQPRAKQITVGVAGCGGAAELAELHETPTTVEVRASSVIGDGTEPPHLNRRRARCR